MTASAYRKMIGKMRKYVGAGKTFNRFRNDHTGYRVGWGTMLKAWRVAEVQVMGRIRQQDVIWTYK